MWVFPRVIAEVKVVVLSKKVLTVLFQLKLQIFTRALGTYKTEK